MQRALAAPLLAVAFERVRTTACLAVRSVSEVGEREVHAVNVAEEFAPCQHKDSLHVGTLFVGW